MKRVLITGGTGFVGTHLVENLIQHFPADELELHVTHFGNHIPAQFQHFRPEQIHQIDLQDSQLVDHLIEQVRPDEIYHLAALAAVSTSFSQAAKVIQNNSSIQLNLLEAISQYVPESRILTVGSAEEYGISSPTELPINEDHPFRPINPYAVSKVTQDLLAYSYFLSRKLNILRVRPFNHTGEGQTTDFAIPSFAAQIVEIELGKRRHLLIGNLEAKRDITDVKDMVAAYQLVMEKGVFGEVYNIGSGRSVTMRAVLDKLIALTSVKILTETDTSKLRPTDIPEMLADIGKINKLGWEPKIQLDETLSRVLHWWRTQLNH